VTAFELPPQLHQLIRGKGGVVSVRYDLADRAKDCASVIDQRAIEIEQDEIRHTMIITRRWAPDDA
jgi:hypothetical protein